MLSGMLFDIASMPAWLQALTYIFPVRYLVSILQTLFLAGTVWPLILPNLAALARGRAPWRSAATMAVSAAEAGLAMWRRILALVLKELTSLWKDPKTRAVLLVPPLVQVFIFSYAATFDVSHVPLARLERGQRRHLGRTGAPLRRLAGLPCGGGARPSRRRGRPAGCQGRGGGAARAAGLLRRACWPDSRRACNCCSTPDAPTRRCWSAATPRRSCRTSRWTRQPIHVPPLTLEVRDWFNPTLDPQWFILPGLVAVLSLIVSMLVASLSLARERELGTFEQMLVTPLRPLEIMIGKAVPAAIVGVLEANIVIAAALLWFRLPFAGSPLLLEAALLVYMLATRRHGTGDLVLRAHPAAGNPGRVRLMPRRRSCCPASPRRWRTCRRSWNG